MLTHLSIRNYTLVDSLELDIAAGMTAITGETGAGKSIVLGALGQTLGDRTDGDRVRTGASRADIHASFHLGQLPHAQQWLQEHDLHQPDAEDQEQVILRRIFSRDNRTRGYINGTPVTLAQLRHFGEMLIDIHSQHEHQSLLKKVTHRRLLDEYAQATQQTRDVAKAYQAWHQQAEKLADLRANADEVSARYQLLHYQVEELQQLELESNELDALETEQRQLANADHIAHTCQQVASLCRNDNNDAGLVDSLNQAIKLLTQLNDKPSALNTVEQLLNDAQIHLEEASSELDRHLDDFQADPARLQDIEERLSSIYEIARKHRITPEELPTLQANLEQELSELCGSDEQLAALEENVEALHHTFMQKAEKLSGVRHKAAKKLAKAVNEQLTTLAMPHAKLSIQVDDCRDQPQLFGIDQIEFLISTNPGQPARPLHKVASGGELSRVSLAIQVITAATSTTPTLVFDEVDVGIGGATADVVGKCLRKLGEGGQVLCVTHLAQVASKAHQHLQVTKHSDKNKAESTLVRLDGENKIQEIARMMGGETITEQTLVLAKEMLDKQ